MCFCFSHSLVLNIRTYRQERPHSIHRTGTNTMPNTCTIHTTSSFDICAVWYHTLISFVWVSGMCVWLSLARSSLLPHSCMHLYIFRMWWNWFWHRHHKQCGYVYIVLRMNNVWLLANLAHVSKWLPNFRISFGSVLLATGISRLFILLIDIYSHMSVLGDLSHVLFYFGLQKKVHIIESSVKFFDHKFDIRNSQ